MAILNFFLARPEQVLAYVDRGTHLSPRDPATPIFLLFKGWAYFMMDQDEEALVWLRRAAAASPETPVILAALTSQLALVGQDAEARATLAQYLALPSTRTRTVTQWDYVPDDNPAFAQFHQRFRSGYCVRPECRKGERKCSGASMPRLPPALFARSLLGRQRLRPG